jgi:hypothetical protein
MQTQTISPSLAESDTKTTPHQGPEPKLNLSKRAKSCENEQTNQNNRTDTHIHSRTELSLGATALTVAMSLAVLNKFKNITGRKEKSSNQDQPEEAVKRKALRESPSVLKLVNIFRNAKSDKSPIGNESQTSLLSADSSKSQPPTIRKSRSHFFSKHLAMTTSSADDTLSPLPVVQKSTSGPVQKTASASIGMHRTKSQIFLPEFINTSMSDSSPIIAKLDGKIGNNEPVIFSLDALSDSETSSPTQVLKKRPSVLTLISGWKSPKSIQKFNMSPLGSNNTTFISSLGIDSTELNMDNISPSLNSPVSGSELTLGTKSYDGRTSGSSIRQKHKTNYHSSSLRYTAAEVSPSNYEKIRLIGRGDVGRVFLVRDKNNHDQLYAMKGIISYLF